MLSTTTALDLLVFFPLPEAWRLIKLIAPTRILHSTLVTAIAIHIVVELFEMLLGELAADTGELIGKELLLRGSTVFRLEGLATVAGHILRGLLRGVRLRIA